MILLITGVAGLVGSRFAEWVLEHKPDVKVIGIDDLSGGLPENIPTHENFTFIRRDALDSLDDIEATHVFHCAAWAAECASPFMRKFNYTSNLVVSANVINYCIEHQVSRMVFCSSLARYGSQPGPFVETLPPLPEDPYAVAKVAVESDLRIAHAQHGLDYCILVPHNIIGRNQNLFDPLRNFISILLYKSLRGDALTIYGDGLQTRQFSDIRDMCLPIWNSLVLPEASTRTINLGGTESFTILDVAKRVQAITGANIIHLPPRFEVRHTSASPELSQKILNFTHQTDLSTTLLEMWNWAQTIPLRPRTILPYEITRDLYPYWTPDALKDGVYR